MIQSSSLAAGGSISAPYSSYNSFKISLMTLVITGFKNKETYFTEHERTDLTTQMDVQALIWFNQSCGGMLAGQ